MRREDKLYPEDLKKEAEQICKKLINDNYTLDFVNNVLTKFVQSKELAGKSFDSVRTQFNDYILIHNEIKITNSKMIDDCYRLAAAVGNENYDGEEIFSKQDLALANRKRAMQEASYWRSLITEDLWDIVCWWYEHKAKQCDKEAQSYQDEYNALMEKRREFNAINAATYKLFECEEEYVTQKKALEEIVRSFHSGIYIINSNEGWRKALYMRQNLVPAEWSPDVEADLIEMGMSAGEIQILKNNGVVLTPQDVITIRESKISNTSSFSSNKSAIIKDGKVYYIYTPKDEVAFEPQWKETVVEKSILRWDWVAALSGIEQETFEDGDGQVQSSDGRVLSSHEKMMQTDQAGYASGLFLFNTILNIVDQGSSRDYVRMCFQESGDTNRVIISVGNTDTAERMANLDYRETFNSYAIQDNVPAMHRASSQAQQVYTLVTGLDTDENKNYTVISHLDERHKDDTYQGTIYYSNGNIMYQPIVYSGDSAYVATCDAVTGNNPQKVCDFTDKLSSPVVANQYTTLIEKAMN